MKEYCATVGILWGQKQSMVWTHLFLFCLIPLLVGSVSCWANPIQESWIPARPIAVQAGGKIRTTNLPAILGPTNDQTQRVSTLTELTFVDFPGVEEENAVRFAVDLWATLLTSPVPIRIQASWLSLDPDVVATGGTPLRANFSNAPQNNTWYPESLADALAGSDLGSGGIDIFLSFNADLTWHTDVSTIPPGAAYDLVSAALSAIGHSIGFQGSMDVDAGGEGNWTFIGLPTLFDLFGQDLNAVNLTNTAVYPKPSTALGDALQSGSVFFSGTQATIANGGQRPELFASNPWQTGFSFHNLDETVYPPGNPNSLMTPLLDKGERVHQPGPIALCILEDLGWNLANSCQTLSAPLFLNGFENGDTSLWSITVP